jgi:hypothetical protein
MSKFPERIYVSESPGGERVWHPVEPGVRYIRYDMYEARVKGLLEVLATYLHDEAVGLETWIDDPHPSESK